MNTLQNTISMMKTLPEAGCTARRRNGNSMLGTNISV